MPQAKRKAQVAPLRLVRPSNGTGKTEQRSLSREDILKAAAKLDRAELLDLRDAINGLVEALEQEELQEQEPAPELKSDSGTAKASSNGWIERKMIPRGVKLHGPYAYLRYRSGGEVKSVYLGKMRSDGSYIPSSGRKKSAESGEG